jgi:hypothetical protein
MEEDLNIGIEEEGDGHRNLEDLAESEAVKGARINLNEWKRGDSSIATMAKSYQGVLQKLATAVLKKEEVQEYRQILLLADYLSTEEADRVTAAIAEALRYGLSLTPILDWITNRCAVGGGRANLIKEIMTHQVITTQRSAWNKKDERIDKRIIP